MISFGSEDCVQVTSKKILPFGCPSDALVAARGEDKIVFNSPLCLVLVLLVSNLSDLDLHAVFGKGDIFPFHLGSGVLAHILHDAVDDISDNGNDSDENEEENEGEEAAAFASRSGHGVRLAVREMVRKMTGEGEKWTRSESMMVLMWAQAEMGRFRVPIA